MTPVRRTKRRLSRKVLDKIEELANDGYAATQVLIELQKDRNLKGEYLPPLRTLQRIIRDDIIPQDPSGPWSLADSEGIDAPAILEVLAEVISHTEGRVKSVTRNEAKWIVSISRAVPDLPTWGVFTLARAYLKREETKESTADLDTYLAFAPWRDREHEEAYKKAVEAGYVTETRPNTIYYRIQLEAMKDKWLREEENNGEAG